MESSAISVYENINTSDNLSKSCVNRKLNGLLNINTDREIQIFCPLCVKSFSFKFSLFEHLRTFHDNFLIQANNQTLKFKECLFCSAKFYGNHLTAKHILNHHSKVVEGLFVNKNRSKCFFCSKKLNKENCNNAATHIEDYHFLQFEDHIRKMFSCDTTQEMSISEFINLTVENSESVKWEDVCMNFGKHFESFSDVKDFDEASRINCYDFTDLKQQLENIKNVTNLGANSKENLILKDFNNTYFTQKSAQRVLRFDFPCDKEGNKNLMFPNNFNMLKQISFEECKLLSNDKKANFFSKSLGSFCEKPKHSSTPNSRFKKISNNETEFNESIYQSRFKSYVTKKEINKLEFQCGKCRLLFKENFELVSHVKNNHKKFSLNAFQPHYHCAICNARFYRNCYLRKHHNLHRPY